MQYRAIIVKKKDNVATIMLNRPDKKNAANRTMLEEISNALADIERDNDIRVVVITGQKDFFCAGEDVTGFDFDTGGQAIDYMKVVVATYKYLEAIPKVVVAAVNGQAYGYGAGIILACDIVFASDRAVFGLRQINWGLVPTDLLTRGLELMSKRDIAYLALTGDDVTAQEARELGWINKVVPHEELMSQTYALCDRLKLGAPLAQGSIKRLLNKKASEEYDSTVETIAALFATEDALNARKAFVEKKKPVFRGR